MNTDAQLDHAPEYDRFKDFTRRILAVPKIEADEAGKKVPPLKRGRKKSEKRESK